MIGCKKGGYNHATTGQKSPIFSMRIMLVCMPILNSSRGVRSKLFRVCTPQTQLRCRGTLSSTIKVPDSLIHFHFVAVFPTFWSVLLTSKFTQTICVYIYVYIYTHLYVCVLIPCAEDSRSGCFANSNLQQRFCFPFLAFPLFSAFSLLSPFSSLSFLAHPLIV